ncbi:DUF3747 domain-containing protein [Baaleninema simplex]|uniref:DUF3747 domain-containing protein n=1 Tax=Baaleninema simplex TaxID=2862350 RepID=UPI00034C25FA|nr:DUF3747 domain-containing protein [Baaleninema simplex]
MKLARRLTALATVVFSTVGTTGSALATAFESSEVERADFIAIAAPIGQTNGYQLLLVEQIADTRPCWTERGTNPTAVEPLLLDFDFTGICGRATDSNGYSIRMGDRDLGMQYSLRVVQRGSELVLIGLPFGLNRNLPQLEIGRTRGLTSGFTRIYLDPGWRLTRRTYQGRTLGHIYLTHDLTLAEFTQLETPSQPATATTTPEVPVDATLTLDEAEDPDITIEFGETPTVPEAVSDEELLDETMLEETEPDDASVVPPLQPREAFRNPPSPLPELVSPER